MYVLHDANFNVTALTDASGNIIEWFGYDPYGMRTVLDANWTTDADGESDVAFVHGHQGLRLDPATGLYDNRLRPYDPALGRFTSQDPLGYVDGVNVYQYVGSNAVAFVDPVGLDRIDLHPTPGGRTIVTYVDEGLFSDEETDIGYMDDDSGEVILYHKELGLRTSLALLLAFAEQWTGSLDDFYREKTWGETSEDTRRLADEGHTLGNKVTILKQREEEMAGGRASADDLTRIQMVVDQAVEFLKLARDAYAGAVFDVGTAKAAVGGIGHVDDGKAAAAGLLGTLVRKAKNALKGRETFRFRGAARLDGLREATHADIVKAFEGTAFTPRGHFIKRLKDERTHRLGVRTFKDIESIIRSGHMQDADDGAVALVRDGIAIIVDPETGHLITLRPW